MDQGRGTMNKEFVITIPGILKIAEIVSSLLTFAIAAGAGPNFQYVGGGWIVFNGVLGFLVAIAFFCLYFFNFYPDFLVNFMIEPITNGVLAVCYLISGIVAAARSASPPAYYDAQAVGAASFFAFLSMALFAVDAVLVFLSHRSSPRSTTTTTTTTTTNVPSEYASQNAVY